MRTKTKMHLSPSDVHQQLMKQTTPELRYDGAKKHRTVIGNDVFVGSDSQLVAPVNIGDGAFVGAGSTITNDVESGALAVSRARQRAISGWNRPRKKSD